MMYYDHALLGATVALASGAHRRHGWPVVVMAAVAAMLPDWDGLSKPFGPAAYARAHRVWGHNVAAAVLAGGLFAAAAYLARLSARERAPYRFGAGRPFSRRDLAAWVALGVLAGLTHVLADLVYSGRRMSPDWPVALLWPFTERGWAFPLVPWADWGVTLILAGGLAAACCRPRSARALAAVTLLATVGYVAGWAVLGA
jgi:membrane-bound metal-dependent hydrolase YbcI (DUF457 family)